MRVSPLRVLMWIVATLMVAGIVHLATILLLPRVSPDTAFARLSRATRLNALSLLPQPREAPGAVPFRDPALASAICRYDLRLGPVRIEAPVGDAAFLSLSVHAANGTAFYALTDRSQNAGRLDVLLLTPEQLETLDAAATDDEPVPEIRVTAPDPEGFVEVDALPRVGGPPAAMRLLESARCQLEGGR